MKGTAEQQVQASRDGNELPLPDFASERIEQIENSIDYPPTGSATREIEHS